MQRVNDEHHREEYAEQPANIAVADKAADYRPDDRQNYGVKQERQKRFERGGSDDK